jgi:hypothetical protein
MKRLGTQIIIETYEQDRLKRLVKRAEHLEKRILTSDKNLSYDKAEASALRWVVSVIQELQNAED